MTLAKAHPCPTCGCACECFGCSGDVPAQLQVVIAGFTDGGSCSNCDEAYNGTFILDRHCGDCSGGGPCFWEYVTSPACTSAGIAIDRIGVQISEATGFGTGGVIVYFRRSAVAPGSCSKNVTWVRDSTTTPSHLGPVNCQSLSSYEVPISGGTIPGMIDGSICSRDSTSAFITAL